MNSINEIKTELSESLIKKSDLYITPDCDSYNGGENGNDTVAEVTETNGKYCEEESDLDKTEDDTDTDMSLSTDSLEGDQELTRNRFNVVLTDNTVSEASDPVKLMEETSRLRSLVEEINRSKVKTDYELVNLRINLEEAKNENSTVLQELENTRNKLSDADKLISTQDKLVKDLEEILQENTFRHSDRVLEEESGADSPDVKHISDLEQDVNRLTIECKSLHELVQKLEDANSKLSAD